VDRIILHSDANCFYASVEMLHHPELAGRPLAVGGDPEKRHGIVLTANYIAKRRGVKTGMALWEARKACPEILFVPPHYDLYLRFSSLLREIYADYSDRTESFGLDESWIDITHSCGLVGDGRKVAQEISDRVKRELGITVSIGVSWNKIFAKFGSDYKKPDAITEVSRDTYRQIVWPRPVSDLLYVGRATDRKLHSAGIRTIGELAVTPPDYLQSLLGKMGWILYLFANGEDSTPVSLEGETAPIKSIGNGMTTPRDLVSDDDVKATVYLLSESVATRLRQNHFVGDVVELSVRDKELLSFTRQKKICVPTDISAEIAGQAMELFHQHYRWHNPIRSMGVRVSDLKPETAPWQLNLFVDPLQREKQLKMDRAADEIRRRFGPDAVKRGIIWFGPDMTARKREEQGIHPYSYFQNGNQVATAAGGR